MGTLIQSTPRSAAPRAFYTFWMVLLLLAGGCEVSLISAYDPELDRAATALQKQMDAHLTALEAAAGTPAADYAAHQQFYDGYAVELRSAQIRAGSQPQNDITKDQYELMLSNLEQLRVLHQAGPLVPEVVQATRDLFNQAWQAIIKLELAKKRGEG